MANFFRTLPIVGKGSAFREAMRARRRVKRFRAAESGALVTLDKTNATFVAVTGSSGKSTTTALLALILEKKGRTRKQIFANTVDSIVKGLREFEHDEDYAVIEAGIGAKGDMAAITRYVKPHVAIVTMIGLEHYSVFRSREAVAEEKGLLVEAIKPGGFAVLNADDPHTMDIARRTKERIVTFGRDKPADYRVTGVRQTFPGPLCVDIAWGGGTTTVESRLLGTHFWVPIAASFAAACELGVPVEDIADAVARCEPLPNRCQKVPVENGPTFIVDTAKAPAGTVTLPMEILRGADAPRKRVVLGQISDYAGNPVPKYRDAYRYARDVADQVIMVGENRHRHRASEEDIAQGRVIELRTARDVYDYLRETAIPGELILLKSSRNIHLERVAIAYTTEVRCWVDNCGVRTACQTCGFYGVPFKKHRSVKKRRRLIAKIRKLLRRPKGSSAHR